MYRLLVTLGAGPGAEAISCPRCIAVSTVQMSPPDIVLLGEESVQASEWCRADRAGSDGAAGTAASHAQLLLPNWMIRSTLERRCCCCCCGCFFCCWLRHRVRMRHSTVW